MSLFVSSQDDEHSYNARIGSHALPQLRYSFSGSTNQINHLADIFSAINSINHQALMIIKPTGIRIYAEHNHVSNVLVTIEPSLFTQFNFLLHDSSTGSSQTISPGITETEEQGNVAELRLGVDISLIGDSFASVASSLGSSKSKQKSSTAATGVSAVPGNPIPDSVTCYITYEGEGYPLVIEFEDNLMSEKLEFLTFYTDLVYPYDDEGEDGDQDHLVVNHNDIQFELMLRSDVFANLLQDLQQISTLDLYIYLSNEKRTLGNLSSRQSRQRGGPVFLDNQLNFISKGPIGHSKLIYPNEKTILEKLLIFSQNSDSEGDNIPVNTSLISCYNFATFIRIFRAVKMSSKCKILKDFNGVLSIQVLCKNPYLPNYAGTLINFNMLEVSTVVNEMYEENGNSRININNLFDDESYEYIKNYNSSKNIQRDILNDANTIQEYQPLAEELLVDTNPKLSYAMLRSENPGEIANTDENIQINETIYEAHQAANSASIRKKRKTTNNGQVDDDGSNIKNVGGAVEVPLFL
ncbi:hypothetical protein G9P44_004049 [Scheffersomyces stipitis]|nr:hypothetical protein G9P44_004049 [Scheffersomyces stipitis]